MTSVVDPSSELVVLLLLAVDSGLILLLLISRLATDLAGLTGGGPVEASAFDLLAAAAEVVVEFLSRRHSELLTDRRRCFLLALVSRFLLSWTPPPLFASGARFSVLAGLFVVGRNALEL